MFRAYGNPPAPVYHDAQGGVTLGNGQLRWLGLLAPLIAGVACGDASTSCPATETVGLFCDFTAPEDLEVLPGEDRMLVSEYGGLAGKRPGTIKLLQLATSETEVLYPTPGGGKLAADERWGEPSCGEPIGAAFAPHGIHLGKGPGGADRLLVVNHGKRESIEMFELTGADSDTPELHWRGCVVAPDDLWLNDVAGLPDGGFVASHMMKRGTSVDDLLHRGGERAAPQGYAVEWSPDAGWNPIAGANGVVTNGVEISADGGVAYVNFTLSDRVVAIDRATGEQLWEASVVHPDNSSWAPDGRLLVASIRGDLESILECVESDAPFCPIDYAVVAIDPETGATATRAEGGGVPFGMATVAVQIGSKLYLGSAAGQRIGVVDARGAAN